MMMSDKKDKAKMGYMGGGMTAKKKSGYMGGGMATKKPMGYAKGGMACGASNPPARPMKKG